MEYGTLAILALSLTVVVVAIVAIVRKTPISAVWKHPKGEVTIRLGQEEDGA